MFWRHNERFRSLNFVLSQISTAHQGQSKRRRSDRRTSLLNSRNIANPIRGLTFLEKLEYPRQGHKGLDRGRLSAIQPKPLPRPESSSAQYFDCFLPRELRAPGALSSLPSIPPLLLKVPSCRPTSIQPSRLSRARSGEPLISRQ